MPAIEYPVGHSRGTPRHGSEASYVLASEPTGDERSIAMVKQAAGPRYIKLQSYRKRGNRYMPSGTYWSVRAVRRQLESKEGKKFGPNCDDLNFTFTPGALSRYPGLSDSDLET